MIVITGSFTGSVTQETFRKKPNGSKLWSHICHNKKQRNRSDNCFFFILLLGKCFSILLFVVEMPFTLFFFWRVRFCSWFLRDHKVISDTGCGTVDKVM